MALVQPFRAFRYNTALAPFDRVLTQPYDKISPAMQEKYYAADPNNLIAIEKGRVYPDDSAQNNVYTRAAATLNAWIAQNVVRQDSTPAFYAYSQEYTVPGTAFRRTRRGFIGLGHLEDYAAGVVFRHEHTLSGPKADRLELLRHTRTHTGQLFMLYSDTERRIDALLQENESVAAPVTEMTDEYGVVHRLWIISDPHQISFIQDAMAPQKLVIADGHHRYETSLNFRDVVIALGLLKDFYAKEMGIERAADIPLGFDCAGVVSAVGEGVTDLAVGDGPLPREWRTPPLWGVADSAPYMHDGRAATLEEAINLHGGQGRPSAARFVKLAVSEQAQLISFLKTLRAPQP